MKLIETIVLLALCAVMEMAAEYVEPTEASLELKTVIQAETEELSESEQLTEAESASEIESTTKAESASEIESTTKAESTTETEQASETPNIAETEGLSERETEMESTNQTETESENLAETESERAVIRISNIHIAEENGEKVYDGTNEVKVEADQEGVPEGIVCRIIGKAESCNVGCQPVEVMAVLDGEGWENVQVCLEEEQPLSVAIVPKPLRLEISDAKKSYYSDNRLKQLTFQEESEIQVYGFLEDAEGTPILPENFEMPQLEIDESILQKDSPMFKDSEEIIYQNAITVKKDDMGKITGNPTQNYCFCDEEEWLRKGNVVLSAAPVMGTLDYHVRCAEPSHSWQDAKGRFWIKKGETILIEPEKNRGFTDGKVISNIQKDGEEEFCLTWKLKNGEILAESQIRSVNWFVDDKNPEGYLTLSPAGNKIEETIYSSEEITIQMEAAQDYQSGLRTRQMMVLTGAQADEDPGQWYQNASNQWTEQSTVTLAKDGKYRVIARLEDHVGNVSYFYTEKIVIDHQNPHIEIDGPAPGSANNGDVSVTIKCDEENMKEEDIKISVNGYQNGKKNLKWQTEKINGVLQLKSIQFPYEKKWDDIYDIYIEATDFAGNKTEEQIRFSVNRFGSVYYIDGNTKRNLQKFYLRQPCAVVIKEVNVDYLTRSRITVGYEGHVRILEKEKDYSVSRMGTDSTWKEYIYTIPASVFSKEGFYYVECFSMDRAANTTDNRIQKKKLNFAIDKTPPEIIISGLEEDHIYEGSQRQVHVESMDNLTLDYLELSINGKKSRYYDCTEQKVMLNEMDQWQTFQATAVDKAGNQKIGDEIYYWLGNKSRVKQLRKTKTVDPVKTEKDNTSPSNSEPEHKSMNYDKIKEGEENQEVEQTDLKPVYVAGIAIFTVFAAIFYKIKTSERIDN